MDAELSGELARDVSRHLGDCSGCRAAAEALEGLSALLRSSGDVPVPTGLLRRIESAAAHRGETAERPWRQRTIWALPRIAAVLVGVLAIELVLGTAPARPGLSLAAATFSQAGSPSSLHLLAFESQAGLELDGSFRGDFRDLAMSPEDRLMFDVAGGR